MHVQHTPCQEDAKAWTGQVNRDWTACLLCQQLPYRASHLAPGLLGVAEAGLGCGRSSLAGHLHQAKPMLTPGNCQDNSWTHRLMHSKETQATRNEWLSTAAALQHWIVHTDALHVCDVLLLPQPVNTEVAKKLLKLLRQSLEHAHTPATAGLGC